MQITSLNSVSNSLSYDIVRFKIELGVEEKFMCKNVTKQTQHGDRPVQQIAMAGVILQRHSILQFRPIWTHTPNRRVEPNLTGRSYNKLIKVKFSV